MRGVERRIAPIREHVSLLAQRWCPVPLSRPKVHWSTRSAHWAALWLGPPSVGAQLDAVGSTGNASGVEPTTWVTNSPAVPVIWTPPWVPRPSGSAAPIVGRTVRDG